MSSASSVRNVGGGASSTNPAAPCFECNICFDNPCDPVVTECGHLYCWKCLFKWMQTKSNCPLCPVCKSKVEKNKVIPVYGRGMQDRKDPREETITEEKLPPRPRGHRTEAQTHNGPMPFGAYGLPQARFGNPHFGTFSFTLVPSLFGLHFQYPPTPMGTPTTGNPGPATSHGHGPLTTEQEQHDLISKLLLVFALFIIFCLLFC
mmetsp:Transcript_5800/g.17326  ORF Transcript_5800/g.17326 Transcript_5800/m.17326 type:complete len:205 (+) Transcript_5800:189-803(+)